MAKKTFTDEELKELNEEGFNDKEIADKLDVARSSVCQRRNKLGLDPNGKKGFPQEKLEKIEKWNKEGLPDYKIAEKLGISQPHVSRKRREMGLERNNHPPYTKKEKYGKAIKYVEEVGIAEKQELIEIFDLDKWETLRRRIRENGLSWYNFEKRTVDGLGSPLVYGDLAGKTYVYSDKDRMKELIKKEAPDKKRVRAITDILD